MELLRIFVVALMFAGVSVFSYYALSTKSVSWETLVNVVTGENSTEDETETQPNPAGASSTAESETLPELPSSGSPFAGSSTQAEDPLDCLPGLDESLDSSPATQTAGKSADKNATSTEEPPTLAPAVPQAQIGNSAAPVSSAVENSSPVTEISELPDLPTLNENAASSGSSSTVPLAAPKDTSDSPMVQSAPVAAPTAQLTVQPAAALNPEAEKQAISEYLATASEKIQNGDALEVLRALSPYYGDARFSKEDSDRLVNILVQAATQVIYSQKSFLEPAYVVQVGDTLESIAQKYEIPAEFIARVNGLAPGMVPQPGQSLKVLRGPFTAMVYLDRYELVLTLNGMFAGRFWIGVGGDMTVFDGDFYYRQILRQGGDPNSPQFAFEFVPDRAMVTPGAVSANSLILHPTNDPNVIGKTSPHGNILLSVNDMASLNALLGTNTHLVLRSHLPATAAISAGQPAPAASSAAVAPAPAASAAAPAPMAAPSAPAVSSVPDPIASPVSQSMGSQASLPGLESPSDAAATPLVDELPAELP